MSRVPRTQGPPCLDAQASGKNDAGAGEVERIVGSIGLKVFSLRKSMGLSLQQLGERSDVSAAAIHKIEQGGMVPTITTLLKLAGPRSRPVSSIGRGARAPGRPGAPPPGRTNAARLHLAQGHHAAQHFRAVRAF